MAWNKIQLDKIIPKGETLTISKSGINFGANFISSNNLIDKKSVEFYTDSLNPYKLGFKFLDDESNSSLTLQKKTKGNSASNGRFTKAKELINKLSILKKIQESENRNNQIFEILNDDSEDNVFFVNLKPCFENFINYEDLNMLDSTLRGIYRYIDEEKKVIYIGKGIIKERAKSQDRDKWNIKIIEYSVIEDDDDSYHWENFYLDEYKSRWGALPAFNRVSGHSR